MNARVRVIPAPNSCGVCGVEQREHFQRWQAFAGWHTWIQPSNKTRLARMRARRETRRG